MKKIFKNKWQVDFADRFQQCTASIQKSGMKIFNYIKHF